jgi:uncharacterized protein (TIGR03435 family)
MRHIERVPECLLISAAMAPLICGYARAQLQNRPRFDVVSIKPNSSGLPWSSGSPIKAKVGRYSAHNVTVRNLIGWFFGVNAGQIISSSHWIDVDRYDVDAETEGQPTVEELGEMLKSLLRDRFRLEIHFESREGSRYALVAPKSGLKYGAHCVRADDRDCPVGSGSPGCRGLVFGQQGLIIEHMGLAQVAATLSTILGQVVQDETGLSGKYDFKLEWDVGPTDGPPTVSLVDNLITAFREQTGLRLESRKGIISVLVVDQVEKPTPN